ncbi:putative FKBP-type peptidyl-prolyl cis-trans isomerase 5 [Monocercomonoides exilis]|uniref:putative FKBP-type peptidyl-prolyl cis-trans isomerase 5 n=1 Tax=Monocercomonoides exilis TaxID=2049356 RepID=UPI003559B8C5|nr:putative FKBP-type peptidyl-prolyl cis-trans isomerase 5 [Monocercomonoides exilis]|eukprot:MONOS_8765.1-p1 / transcript=MONOS_8765.1 / gene=MONOS_8765 / organism=Monocercomonoides_exilis_PA203 / gene_product=GH15317 / transcript_product=GH15317 / location=Mono_scaffold00339:39868-40930(+) / protein_length=329 / sequence_SO=supercontig / SO=protein_coding / is_pseudo=false
MDKTVLALPIAVMVASTVVFVFSMHFNLRQILIFAYTFATSMRLLTHLAFRVVYDEADRRLDKVRSSVFGRIVFSLGVAMYAYAFTAPAIVLCSIRPQVQPRFNTLDIAGAVTWFIGSIVETTSDIQMFRFKHNQRSSARIYNQGLWKFMRHPNYIGNLHQVWGNFLLCASTLQGAEWATVAAPVFLTVMMLFGTGVPVAEWAMRKKYRNDIEYQNYLSSAGIYLPFIAMGKALFRKFRGRRGFDTAVFDGVLGADPQTVPLRENEQSAFAPRMTHELETYPKQGSLSHLTPPSPSHISAYGVAADSKRSQLMEGQRGLPQLGAGIASK